MFAFSRSAEYNNSTMKVKRFVSDLDRIMSLIYDDVPLPPREEKPREYPVWEERAREAVLKEPPVLEALKQLPPGRKTGAPKKPAKPEIRIDFNALDGIRADSEYTMERLMTEEEQEIEPVIPEIVFKETETASENEADRFGLDPLELRVLSILLEERDLSGVDLKGRLLSVIIDGINEKLFDEVGDLIIDNETSPVLIEDYKEELQGLFIKEIR